MMLKLHSQRMGHVRGDTHKLAEDQWTLVGLLLANDIFHTCRVHAIAKWSDKSEISNAQERVEFVLFDHLMTIFQDEASVPA